jgi:hypothetical protein
VSAASDYADLLRTEWSESLQPGYARYELRTIIAAGDLSAWSKRKLRARWRWSFKRTSALWDEVVGSALIAPELQTDSTQTAQSAGVDGVGVAVGERNDDASCVPSGAGDQPVSSPSPPTGEVSPREDLPSWLPSGSKQGMTKRELLEAVERLRVKVEQDLKAHNQSSPGKRVAVTRAWHSRRRGKTNGPSRQLQVARHIVEHGEAVTWRVWAWFIDQKLAHGYGGHGLDTWLKMLPDYTEDCLAGVQSGNDRVSASAGDVATRAWGRLKQAAQSHEAGPGVSWHFSDKDPSWDAVVTTAVAKVWGSWSSMTYDSGFEYKGREFRQAFIEALSRRTAE